MLKNPIPQYEILTPSPTKYTPSKYTENAKLQGPLCGETRISVSSIRQLQQELRDRCWKKDVTLKWCRFQNHCVFLCTNKSTPYVY